MTIGTKAAMAVRSSLATALVAVTLLAAAPAQAGGNVGFSFSFSSGNGTGVTIGDNGRRAGKSVSHRTRQRCMGNQQVAQHLSNYGFSNIRFKSRSGRHIKATAVRGRWVYSMRIDRCTGDVTRLKKERRVQRNNRQSNGLHFEFSIR